MAPQPLEAQIQELARQFVASQRTVAFTGAGISTESGIPDFRGPGGTWTRYQPVTIQEFLASHAARTEYWRRQCESHPAMAQAQPNAAHLALAELERMGKLDCVITQNIDGLHQQAGSSPEAVFELHGSNRSVICLSCAKRWTRDEIYQRLLAGEEVPTCDECGGWLKPATVSFGQAMPERILAEAERAARQADLFVVIGSTLIVYPAAALPGVALENGATLSLVNLSETPYDHAASLVIRERAGVVMSAVLEQVRSALP